MDAQAAAAEPQNTAAFESSPMDKAEEAILAREDAGGGVPAKPAARPAANEPAKKPRAVDVAAIATREWKAQQTERAANDLRAKYAPLDEAMSKKDFVGVLNHLAKEHGATFADILKVLEHNEPAKEKTPGEIAAETVREELRKADEARTKADGEARTRDIETRVASQKEAITALAESDGTRWELAGMNPVVARADDGKPVLANEYAWMLIEADWDSQPAGPNRKSMALADALDLVEAKLREKQSARRPKVDDGKPKSGANTGNEAVAKKVGGKAGKPSFTNRSTSGAATVASEDDDDLDDESAGISDGDAITRAAKKAGIKLR